MFFSIIVPVYNVEEYISKCIESILTQTYKDFEIILVNDGSRDSSGVICDTYLLKNPKVKVIHKQNGGLSDARNSGFIKSTGQYVIYLDGDDFWLNPFFLENAANFIKNNGPQDVILFQGNKLYEKMNRVIGEPRYNSNYINSHHKDDVLKHLIITKSYSMSACTKILSRDFIKENKLYFKNNLLGEDLDWFLSLINTSCRITALDDVNYLYRIRENSITQSISEKNLSDGLKTVELWLNKLNLIDLDPKYKKYYYSILTKAYIVNMLTYARVEKNVRAKYVKEVKKNNNLLKNWISRDEMIIFIFNSIFGLGITSTLMKIYYYYKMNNYKKISL